MVQVVCYFQEIEASSLKYTYKVLILRCSELLNHYSTRWFDVYKFWLVGYFDIAMHSWVTVRYIPNRLADNFAYTT